MSWLGSQIRRVDRLFARLSHRRRVLVDARTAMNFAILAPVFERLQRDPRVEVLFTADRPADVVAGLRPDYVTAEVMPNLTALGGVASSSTGTTRSTRR
jgi:hypothetical protein